MSVVNASFDQPLELEEHATLPLAGGIEQMGFQCGQLLGVALAAGAQAYHTYGPGPQAETAALMSAQKAGGILPQQLQEHQLPGRRRSGLEEHAGGADNQILAERWASPLLQHDRRLCTPRQPTRSTPPLPATN